MTNNPFAVLGLDPNLVSKLSGEGLEQVVRAQYLSLQKVFHPDKSRDNGKYSRLLNWAYGELRNPVQLAMWKSHFTDKRRSKSSDQIKELVRLNDSQLRYLFGVMKSAWQSSLVSAVDLIGLGNKTIRVIRPSILDPLVQMQIIGEVGGAEERKRARDRSRMKSNFELYLEGGCLKRREGDGSIHDHRRLPVGVLTSDVIARHNNGSSEPPLRAVTEAYRRLNNAKALPIGRSQEITRENLVLQIPAPVFAGIAGMLSQELEQYSYLFSASTEEGELVFHLEGLIAHISE